MPDVVRAHLVVRGVVQGVFFRGALQADAQRMGVVGGVRNRHDGRVEGEAQGPREAIDAVLAWARRGPAAARVAEVTVTWMTPAEPPEASFDVRR